ncbi:MmpS family transport accessory protein [Corynebacterium provencense]|uniref:MmpS family transport accessory protein n=1 Tax=Corynebacterium provencense TaxID=1737425 RepID=UPI000832FD9B|nr:MmpS family transport accessory protein [Corynebacterium provencense]
MTDQNPYGQQPQQPGQPYPAQSYQQPEPPKKKPFYKRVWFIILAIIVVIIIIAGVAGGGDDKKDTASANSTAAAAPEAQPGTESGDQSGAQPGTESDGNVMQLVLESDGAPINASWLQNGNTAQEQGVASGWTKDIPADTKWDALMNNVTGQLDGAGTLTCRILWNGEVITESTSTGDYAVVTCTPDMDKM